MELNLKNGWFVFALLVGTIATFRPESRFLRSRMVSTSRVKIAVSLAKGKREYDKRETIKKRETDRETRAAIKERRR